MNQNEDLKFKKIVVAESTTLVRKITSDLLNRMGIGIVDSASNALELINKVYALRPDAVIVDYAIQANHKNIINSIKESSPDTNIIISVTSKKELINSYSYGVRDFVSKPISENSVECILKII
jgi:DNA-binding NarL/FixJ family response regulator